MPTISPFWSTQHQYFPQLNIVPTFSPLWTLPDMVESYVDKMRMERQDIDFYVGKLKGRHGDKDKQEGNVLLEPAAPMFHLLIFGNVSIKNPKIHEIQKSVNSKNP